MSTTCRALILLLMCAEGRALHGLTNASSAQTMASPPFYKTSFDCGRAKELSTEAAICRNEELAKLDVETAAVYRKRLASATAPEKSELVLSQRQWLEIRNSYNCNPYHGDPAGMLSDLAELYRRRIEALGSGQMALQNTEVPKEYEWLRTTAPEGFSKGFSISRAYASCEDPCKKKPSLYRWISMGGIGIGEAPGDVDTPFAKIEKKLATEDWTKCRSADDSGKPTIDYFTKNEKMVAVTRYYSMGVGNSIGLAITISAPLPQNPPKPPANPTVNITDDWMTYSNPDVGLQLRYPPTWRVRDDSPANDARGYKYLLFSAKDYTGDFRITMQAEEMVPGSSNINKQDPAPRCLPSGYRVSGFSANECIVEGENVGEGTCNRYLGFIDVAAGKYHFSFEPSGSGSFVDDSGEFRLTDFYQKILSTVEIKQSD